MTKGKARELDYVEVPIHQDFYYNRELGLPTVIHQFETLEKTLVDSHYLACITVQIDNLNQIEYQYGSSIVRPRCTPP